MQNLVFPSFNITAEHVRYERLLRRQSKFGYVYAINFSDGAIKVGRTKSPLSRIGGHISNSDDSTRIIDIAVSSVCEYCKAETDLIKLNKGKELAASGDYSKILQYISLITPPSEGLINHANSQPAKNIAHCESVDGLQALCAAIVDGSVQSFKADKKKAEENALAEIIDGVNAEILDFMELPITERMVFQVMLEQAIDSLEKFVKINEGLIPIGKEIIQLLALPKEERYGMFFALNMENRFLNGMKQASAPS